MNHSSRYRRNHIVPPSQPRFGAAEAPNPAPPPGPVARGREGRGFSFGRYCASPGEGGQSNPSHLLGVGGCAVRGEACGSRARCVLGWWCESAKLKLN